MNFKLRTILILVSRWRQINLFLVWICWRFDFRFNSQWKNLLDQIHGHVHKYFKLKKKSLRLGVNETWKHENSVAIGNDRIAIFSFCWRPWLCGVFRLHVHSWFGLWLLHIRIFLLTTFNIENMYATIRSTVKIMYKMQCSSGNKLE